MRPTPLTDLALLRYLYWYSTVAWFTWIVPSRREYRDHPQHPQFVCDWPGSANCSVVALLALAVVAAGPRQQHGHTLFTTS